MAPLNLQRLHVYQQSVAAMCLTVLKSHRLVQDERRKASMRKRMNTTGGEEKWFLAPGTHMNAFQVGISS